MGLYVLQHEDNDRRQHQQIPTPLVLFEKFLRFCSDYFAESHVRNRKVKGWVYCKHSCRNWSIDLSNAGEFIPRIDSNSRAIGQLFFSEVEQRFETAPADWLNVLHS